MQIQLRRLVAALAGLVLVASTGLASADNDRDPARVRAELKAQIGETDADTGPAFSFAGRQFANQKAFVDSGARCSTRHVSDFEQQLHEIAHASWKQSRVSAGRAALERAPGSVAVPVWVHVINRGTGISNGDVPESQITAQMNVLNNAYASTGSPFFFTLAGVTRTTNATWYTMTPGSSAESQAKAALRVGGAGHAQHVPGEPGAGPARLGDVPDRLRQPADDGRCRDAQQLGAWRHGRRRTTKATPRRTRSGTGSACTTRSRVAARRRTTRSATRRPRSRRPSVARRAVTAARGRR